MIGPLDETEKLRREAAGNARAASVEKARADKAEAEVRNLTRELAALRREVAALKSGGRHAG